MSNAFLAQLPHIGTTSTLGWQNDALARSYMDHILQRARVLLPRRGWRVGIIKEFYPRGAGLLGLNVNAGSEVCIRFRLPGKRNEFLPFHEVLCTALHEFTHCVHSKHDRAFWNLYYDLVKECEALEVTMIQQGKQLYPEAAYVPRYGTGGEASPSAAASSSRTGRVGGAGSGSKTRTKTSGGKSSFPSKGGHRLGGGQGSSGTGNGGGTMTRSRGGTTTTTTTTIPTARGGRGGKPTSATGSGAGQSGKRNSSATTAAAANSVVFPGEGRRLGVGSGLRTFDDVSPGFTPTRDALRRILAAATERRLRLASAATPGSHLSTGSLSNPAITNVHTLAAPEKHDLSASDATVELEEGEEDIPDHVPVSQSALEDQDGSWKCPRCGFCNEVGTGSCQFCGNDDENIEDDDRKNGALSLNEEKFSLKEEEVEEKESQELPPLKKERAEEEAVGDAHSTVSVAPISHVGLTKDDALEISDGDDDE